MSYQCPPWCAQGHEMGPEMIHESEPVRMSDGKRSVYVSAYQYERGPDPEAPSVMLSRDDGRPVQLDADGARTVAQVLDTPDTWAELGQLVGAIRDTAAAIESEAG